MSECKHEFETVNVSYLLSTLKAITDRTKELTYEEKDAVITVCRNCERLKSDVERDELQAQVKEREREIEQIEVKCCACHAWHITQVAVLRGALERARKGFVNLIDLNLLPSEEYEKDANKIAQHCFEALADTPSEASERVQKLVAALEEVEKMGTYKNNGTFSEDVLEEPWAVIAGNALAEWKNKP